MLADTSVHVQLDPLFDVVLTAVIDFLTPIQIKGCFRYDSLEL